jgi:hypothetical protein
MELRPLDRVHGYAITFRVLEDVPNDALEVHARVRALGAFAIVRMGRRAFLLADGGELGDLLAGELRRELEAQADTLILSAGACG